MKQTLFLSIVLSGTLLANEPKVYIDMNPVQLNYSNNGTGTDFKPTGFKWTVGYLIKDFNMVGFGIEASAMLGVNSDEKARIKDTKGIELRQASVVLDKLYSLHLKTVIPFSSSFNANLYIGTSRAKVESLALNAVNKSSFENSVSYGAGLEYWSMANVSVYGNYMQYFNNLSAIEVGLGFRF